MNNEWKNGYREGFADGYTAAKKEMINPYAGVSVGAGGGGTVTNNTYAVDPRSNSIRTTGYPPTGTFVAGMSVMSDEC